MSSFFCDIQYYFFFYLLILKLDNLSQICSESTSSLLSVLDKDWILKKIILINNTQFYLVIRKIRLRYSGSNKTAE